MAKTVTLEEKKQAVRQCLPAINTIRGIMEREGYQPCRQFTSLDIKEFPGAPSLNNGAFKFLAKEAAGVPIRVLTDIKKDHVFVVVATDNETLEEDITEQEKLFLDILAQ